MKKIVESLFSVDIRALAVTRISAGCILLVDLIIRLIDVKSQLSDAGILPRADVFAHWDNIGHLSLHMLSGGTWWQVILILVQIVFALFLIVGYRTTLSTIVSWFLLISLHDRLQIVLNSGDVWFRMLLFWGMFVPWGSYLSIDYVRGIKSFDAFKSSSEKIKRSIVSVGTAGIMIQGVLVYLFTGLLKYGSAWTEDFTAIYFTLSNGQFARTLGEVIASVPTVTIIATPVVLYLEIIGGALLLWPWWKKYVRTGLFFTFALLQLMIALTMDNVGLFGVISVVGLIPFLPKEFWDASVRWIRDMREKRVTTEWVIYYDNECSFCYRAVQVVRGVLILPMSVRVEEAQKSARADDLMRAANSWIVSYGPNMYTGARALSMLTTLSPFNCILTPILRIPIIEHFGNFIYQKIAHGREAICHLTKTPRPSHTKTVIASIALVYIIVANIETLPTIQQFTPQRIHNVAYTFHLHQGFFMFAPYPTRNDGWYVVKGTDYDGVSYNLFTGGAGIKQPDLTNPENIFAEPSDRSAIFANNRWWRYFSNISHEPYEHFQIPYLTYTCQEWERTQKNKLDTVELIFVTQYVPELGKKRDVPRAVSLRTISCTN